MQSSHTARSMCVREVDDVAGKQCEHLQIGDGFRVVALFPQPADQPFDARSLAADRLLIEDADSQRGIRR